MRLAVLGSPIGHSKSPRIHAAAYRSLGLDWQYDAIEQQRATLPAFLDGLDASWRGLSVTAPLKEEAAKWLVEPDRLVTVTGACNTVLVQDRRGWNTDIAGITRSLEAAGVDSVQHGTILGAGATAVSSLVALHELGATTIDVRLRDAAKGERLAEVARALSVRLRLESFEAPIDSADIVISTLPAAAVVDLSWSSIPRAILDADYAQGESRFATLGVPLVSGTEMLLHQALMQVRIFVHGDPGRELDQESEVWAAMRAAAGA